jgi:hypothetical protein
MKSTTLKTAELLDILPDEDILLINTLVRKLIVAWDPNFTKVTDSERALLDKSETEMRNGDYISEEDFWS